MSNQCNNLINKKNVALFYGGNSPEHEVSIASARTVFEILKEICNKVFLIGISKKGEFFLQENNLINNEIIENKTISIIPSKGLYLKNERLSIDVAFLVTHGFGGEDGKLQGLLNLSNIPFTGCDTTSSGICMSKAFASTILKANKIDTLDNIILTKKTAIPSLDKVKEKLGKNLFIKSETTGSSIGVTALYDCKEEEYKEAINKSFNFSERVLIQTLIEDMDEIECAVLEKDNFLIIGGPGLVKKPSKEKLLSYKIKYSPINGAKMIIDNDLKKEIKQKAIKNSKKAFKILNLKGFARIDYFLTKDNHLILNEINTLPGMTLTSHYPILIESKGISFKETINIILQQALNG